MEGYMLRTIPPHFDLDGYVFVDLAHALTWLAGCPEPDTWYKVAIVDVHYGKRPCQHCGMKQEYFRVKRTLSVAGFLQEYDQHARALPLGR